MTTPPAPSGKPARAWPSSTLMLLANSMPATLVLPSVPSTTSVFSASSRCETGTGKARLESLPTRPERSK